MSSGDFDAPGRTQFVARALAWIAPLVARLARAGLEVESAPLPAADTSAIALRRPGLGPRAALILEVEERAIEAALELPASAPEIDLFRAQLQRASTAERMFAALAHLPEPFALTLHGDAPLPLVDVDLATLQDLARRASEESRRLRVGWRVSREAALAERDVALVDQLEGALAALAVPFALIAALPAGSAPRPAPTTRLFRRPRASSARSVRAPIAVGSRVRIRNGPFEGKDGIVETLDGKGAARVRLGLLATRLALSELLPLDRAPSSVRPPRGRSAPRPALISSHRRR
ncbi:MAG: hypothetical protein HYV09_32955 [Deltaproteobacteria bacterium]|nr:hypothetical protein [Deltaproteobacteria bacterium]